MVSLDGTVCMVHSFYAAHNPQRYTRQVLGLCSLRVDLIACSAIGSLAMFLRRDTSYAISTSVGFDAEFHSRDRHFPLVQCVYVTPSFGIHSCAQTSQRLTITWR